MPTRYLKPGIRDSERIEAVSISDAEILYYRLLVTVDDFGRTDARPLMVKSACFPIRLRATADKCMQWMQELDKSGLIALYEVEGKSYLQITKWDNTPRATSSKFPDPPADVYKRMQMLLVTVTKTVTKTETDKGAAKAAGGGVNGKDLELPDWVPLDNWETYIAMRTKIKKPCTLRAKRMLLGKLDELKEKGFNPAQLLAEAESKCWLSVYEPKG